MHILFLTQVLPYPLDAGPKVRAYYVLRHLAEQGHEVTLVSFVRPDDTRDHVAHLEGFCRAVHTVPIHRSKIKDARYLVQSLLTGQSFIVARDTDRAMHGLVDRLLAEDRFDVVHADQLWMAQYALKCGGVKRILDAHNAVYLIPQRLARHERNPLKKLLLQREWRALARYEGDVCRCFDQVVTVTEEDRQLLAELSFGTGSPRCHSERSEESLTYDGRDSSLRLRREIRRTLRVTHDIPESSFSVIPICVDPAEVPAVEPRPDASRILILGTMFWPPNVEGALWFAREVLPLVLREVPEARLTVIGKNPPAELKKLGTEKQPQIKTNHRLTQMHTDRTRIENKRNQCVSVSHLWFQRNQRLSASHLRFQSRRPVDRETTDEHRPQMNADKRRWDTDGKEDQPVFIRVPSVVPENAADGGIDVLGYVDDPTPYLEESIVFVVPLHAGGGMRVKILDAWCWGIPIVSTTVGAEGIEVRDGENILIADDAVAFAQAVVRVMTDPALARQLRDNGRKWVEQRYNWRTVYSKWDEIYNETTGEHKPQINTDEHR